MWRCSNNINISSPSAKMCFINRAISFAYRMYKTPDPFLLQMIWQIQRQTHKKRVWYLGGGRCMPKMYFESVWSICAYSVNVDVLLLKNENSYFLPYPGSIHDSSEALRVFLRLTFRLVGIDGEAPDWVIHHYWLLKQLPTSWRNKWQWCFSWSSWSPTSWCRHSLKVLSCHRSFVLLVEDEDLTEVRLSFKCWVTLTVHCDDRKNLQNLPRQCYYREWLLWNRCTLV